MAGAVSEEFGWAITSYPHNLTDDTPAYIAGNVCVRERIVME